MVLSSDIITIVYGYVVYIYIRVRLHWRLNSDPGYVIMEDKSCEPGKLEPTDYEIYYDPVGVMHFLPPTRCKNCDD
jgi:hypothetical protein